MAAAKNGRTKADEQPTVITPKVIIDTENREWQPMNSSMDSIQPEIVTDAPTSPVSTGNGLALYDPSINDLQALLDVVEQAEEDSELEVLVIEQNNEAVTQELEVLKTVQSKVMKIRQNKQKAQAGNAQFKAKQRLAEMLKKQIGDPGSI